MSYWDTSALVKLYVAEVDSAYFLQLLTTQDEPIASSAIATTEVLCVLYRKEQAGALRSGAARRIYSKFGSDVSSGRILTIPYSRDVEAEAEKLVSRVFARKRPVSLRSLDVIHVATALSGGARELVTTDAKLREVSKLVGLNILP
ncbi:MAG TPA: type II toxin-antitoxin system VapC family toxin [Acidobacteriota bacterium]|nr:type II toxin-antitoxin system VapC family toxin [Acidobacteriota bacterium]